MSVSSTPENRPVGFIRQFELVDRVRAYDAQVDEALLNQAYVFSMKAHGDQKRKNGDPYFTHPLAVAAILTELKADPQTVATALLHDVVEDTEVTVAEIEDLFGPDIAKMVDGVTKISQRELSSVEMKQAENFRKFIIAVSQDVRVLLVKLADRLHNMRTLEFHDKPGAQKRIALETMEIYAPLAGRIGVQRFRDELEELSFQYLNPDGYETITENLTRLTENAVQSVVHFSTSLRDLLASHGIKAEIISREKKPFSIWRKMQRKGHSFNELADIYGFRVIVETVSECYQALGVIHQNFPMIPSEFDDYISAPKPNNYRSIHTAVLAPLALDETRQKVEVQIRTREMHETAERGIAAHWKYK
ncbi:MAG: HD domain-containing protein, partial [Parvularculaceae bacterium]